MDLIHAIVEGELTLKHLRQRGKELGDIGVAKNSPNHYASWYCTIGAAEANRLRENPDAIPEITLATQYGSMPPLPHEVGCVEDWRILEDGARP